MISYRHPARTATPAPLSYIHPTRSSALVTSSSARGPVVLRAGESVVLTGPLAGTVAR